MLSFLQFLNESAYKSPHEIMNKRQHKAVTGHPDFGTYVHSYTHKVYARPDSNDRADSGVRDFVLANAEQKHRMHVTVTDRGKILSHSIYRNAGETSDGKTIWTDVKHSHQKK